MENQTHHWIDSNDDLLLDFVSFMLFIMRR